MGYFLIAIIGVLILVKAVPAIKIYLDVIFLVNCTFKAKSKQDTLRCHFKHYHSKIFNKTQLPLGAKRQLMYDLMSYYSFRCYGIHHILAILTYITRV